MFLCSFCIVAYVVEDSDKMRYETLCLSSLFSRKCDTINQIATLLAVPGQLLVLFDHRRKQPIPPPPHPPPP